LIHGAPDEVCLQAGLLGQTPRNRQRGAGKIQSGDGRAAPYQAQCIQTNMALQMQHALSKDVAKLGRFNRVQNVLADETGRAYSRRLRRAHELLRAHPSSGG
jgi:uncharacterized protein (DUF924 family)